MNVMETPEQPGKTSSLITLMGKIRSSENFLPTSAHSMSYKVLFTVHPFCLHHVIKSASGHSFPRIGGLQFGDVMVPQVKVVGYSRFTPYSVVIRPRCLTAALQYGHRLTGVGMNNLQC